MAVAMRGVANMDKKIVSISSKRQITIPQKYFTQLGFDNEAECAVRGNEIVIRPVKMQSGGDFAEQILADLISEGLSGEELLKQFRAKQAKIRPAVEEMLRDAESAACGKGKFFTYDDVFGAEELHD